MTRLLSPGEGGPHGPCHEPYVGRADPTGGAQCVPQVRVRELLVVRLLLAGQRPHLDHGGARRADVGQGQQDRLPVGAPWRHLGLGGEHHVGGSRRPVEASAAGSRTRNGRPPNATVRPGASVAASSDELPTLATAVHHQQVAVAAVRHRPNRGRDADSRKTGRPGRAGWPTASHPQTGEHGDGRAGAGQQQHVGRVAAHQPSQSREAESGDRGAGRGDRLIRRRGDRRVEQHLTPLPVGRQPIEGRGTPLQVGVGVGDRQHPHQGLAQKSPAADRGGVSRSVSSSHCSSDIADRAKRAPTIASVACCSTC